MRLFKLARDIVGTTVGLALLSRAVARSVGPKASAEQKERLDAAQKALDKVHQLEKEGNLLEAYQRLEEIDHPSYCFKAKPFHRGKIVSQLFKKNGWRLFGPDDVFVGPSLTLNEQIYLSYFAQTEIISSLKKDNPILYVNLLIELCENFWKEARHLLNIQPLETMLVSQERAKEDNKKIAEKNILESIKLAKYIHSECDSLLNAEQKTVLSYILTSCVVSLCSTEKPEHKAEIHQCLALALVLNPNNTE